MKIKISTGLYVNRVFTPFEGEQVWVLDLEEYIEELKSVEQDGTLAISLTEQEFRDSLRDTGKAEFCGGGHAAFLAEVMEGEVA